MASEGFHTVERVISVACEPDGRFRVLLGPAPHVVVYRTLEPPKWGAMVEVASKGSKVENFPNGGSVRLLSDDAVQRIHTDEPVIRVVPPSLLRRVVASMRRPLLPYQAIGAAWMCERLMDSRGAILADDPGLGKTAQAVAAVSALNLFPAVVACPASLKLNWVNEFKHSRAKPRVSLIEGKWGKFLRGDVYVVNYGVLASREAAIAQIRPAVIVYDEAHELKEADAHQRHRAAVATRLAHYIERVIALTGTPLMNHPKEFWRLLHIVDQHEWPSFEKFDLRYLRQQLDGKASTRNIVTERGRAENVDELMVRSQAAMLRRRKEEVSQDLPSKTIKTMLVNLEQVDQEAYDLVEQDLLAWLAKIGKTSKMTSSARTMALTKLTMLRRIAAVGKLRRAVPAYLRAWFSAAKPSPLVVFGHHRMVLAAVRQQAEHLKIRAVGIQGGDPVAARQAAVDAFQRGDADLFLCPIRAGGVGITLHRAADSLMLERDWSPARQLQAEDRVHRLGQIRPVTITYLDARNTVDEHVASVLSAKKHLIDSLIDGDVSATDVAQGSGALVSGILERMAAARHARADKSSVTNSG